MKKQVNNTNKKVDASALNYKTNVIGTNQEYKRELATLGHCVRALLQAENVKLHPKMLSILKDIKTNKNDAYKIALEKVRKTKSGKYTPFCLFQYLYKEAKK